MCIGDWRLGRLITHKSAYNSIAATATLDIPSNQQRVGIMFSLGKSSATFDMVLRVDGTAVAVMQNFQALFRYTLADSGWLPTRHWEIVNTNATVAGVVVVTELFMPENYLATALQHFETEYGNALQNLPRY